MSDVITASDASETGSGVACSSDSSSQGIDFLLNELRLLQEVPLAPVLILSLFNGVGGAFRAYDICGVRPMARVAVETHRPANRVTSRTWPDVILFNDVRQFGECQMMEWHDRFPDLEEIHIWAGFPCNDLSRAKAGRLNLQGRQSGLFYELMRVWREAKQCFPALSIRFVFENVASMDPEARDQISDEVGAVPYRFDPSHQVPMCRPRFAWTNAALEGGPHLFLNPKRVYVDVIVTDDWPDDTAWVEPGWVRASPHQALPTFMRCVRKSQSPHMPAGISRCAPETLDLWARESYKYSPYQFKPQYLFHQSDRQRVAHASERELLMGFGFEHTALCMNASSAKRSPATFEDKRCALIGDGFAISSFMLLAAALTRKWIGYPSPTHLKDRLGLAPGAVCGIRRVAPIQRALCYGSSLDEIQRRLYSPCSSFGTKGDPQWF